MTARLDRVLVHRHVLRAGDDEVVEPAERERLVDARLARPPDSRRLFHPDPSASSAAAERVVAVPGHLLQLTAECREDGTGGIVDTVVAPERARVVVRDRVAERPGRAQSAAFQEL